MRTYLLHQDPTNRYQYGLTNWENKSESIESVQNRCPQLYVIMMVKLE